MSELVVSLEGVHGVGKTTTLEALKEYHWKVVDEGYLGGNLPGEAYSLERETAWMDAWTRSVDAALAAVPPLWNGARVVVADRGPLSAWMYIRDADRARMGEWLLEWQKRTRRTVVYVVLSPDADAVKQRVAARAQMDAERQALAEDQYLEEIWKRYAPVVQMAGLGGAMRPGEDPVLEKLMRGPKSVLVHGGTPSAKSVASKLNQHLLGIANAME